MNNLRYELYRGREVGGILTGLRLCGYAFHNEQENFYRIKLFLLNDLTYFMSKNSGSGYTIFSKVVTKDDGRIVFQNPVGFAKVMDHIRTHLYVKFSDLGSHMFMNLYPLENSSAA